MKFFNTAGPVNKENHYKIDPLNRFDLEEIMFLIEQEKYFVLHAPRQTGKTSSLLALQKHLNKSKEYNIVYANFETGQTARNDVDKGMRSNISELHKRCKSIFGEAITFTTNSVLEESGAQDALNTYLTKLSELSDKPILLLIDEIDSLVGDTLISVLRQLRAGYDKRPGNFPQSIILCGVRDVRDYRIHTKNQEIITGGSAFNIKAKSLRIGNFSREELELLYKQHTAETGQKFDDGVFDFVWDLTGGQPWLVNALAYEVTFELKENRNRKIAITKDMIFTAKENIIKRRETHLDQLVDKLQEDRVRSVIEPMLIGEQAVDFKPNDVEYIIDLGLIIRESNGELKIANEIYKEVIPRELCFGAQMAISQNTVWYVNKNNCLDMKKLLKAFQEFFRENSENWVQVYNYHEAGPQLLLQAFLQRIINAGGHIHREYALGRKRTDLLITYNNEKFVIETKLLKKNIEKQIEEGIIQTNDYADKCNAKSAFLLIFDRRKNISWDEKIFIRKKTHKKRVIYIYGM